MLHLVKVSLPLVQSSSSSIRPLHIHHEIFNLILQPVFGLFQRGTFSIHSFNSLLSLLQTLSQLFPLESSHVMI